MHHRPRRSSRAGLAAALLALPAALAIAVAGSAAAGQARPPAAPSAPEAAAPEEIGGIPIAGPIRSDDLGPARAALERMVAAYRQAPGLVDEVSIHAFVSAQARPVRRGRVMFEGDEHFLVEAPGSRAAAVDGRVKIMLDRFRTRYVDVPLDGNMFATIRETLDTSVGISWHLRARYCDDPTLVLQSLSSGIPDPAGIHGHEEATLPDGRAVDRVTLWADSGYSVVTIDRETGLVLGMDIEYVPRGTPVGNFRIRTHVRATPRLVESLPEPIAFDPDGRRAVATMQELYGRTAGGRPVPLSVSVGDRVELPEIVTLEGMPWSLEERSGRVQVLLAWSMGSTGFARARTPIVVLSEQLARRGGDVPVDFFLLNTREDTPDEEKWDTVYDFWYERDYEVPCLFDDTDALAETLGLNQLPATIVLDGRGRLVGTVGGIDGTWPPAVNRLIREAVQATAEAEAEPSRSGDGGDAGNGAGGEGGAGGGTGGTGGTGGG